MDHYYLAQAKEADAIAEAAQSAADRLTWQRIGQENRRLAAEVIAQRQADIISGPRHTGLPKHPDAQKIAEFRRKATDAAARAEATGDAFLRQSWENIAQSYQEMADRLERKFKL